MCFSEIRVKRIRVNQGLGVSLFLEIINETKFIEISYCGNAWATSAASSGLSFTRANWAI